MRLRMSKLSVCCIAGLFCAACSGKSGDDGGLVHLDGPAQVPDAGPSASAFTVFDLPECGQAGYQTVAAASGGKVVFATLATTDRSAACTLENRTNVTAPVYDVCVVLPTASSFAGSIATSQAYVARMLSLIHI